MMAMILTEAAIILCPHGGMVTSVPTREGTPVAGAPLLVVTDQSLVEGCTFVLPPDVPSFCVRVEWTMPSAKVSAAGAPVLTAQSVGLCFSAEGLPQGEAGIDLTQQLVGAG